MRTPIEIADYILGTHRLEMPVTRETVRGMLVRAVCEAQLDMQFKAE